MRVTRLERGGWEGEDRDQGETVSGGGGVSVFSPFEEGR